MLHLDRLCYQQDEFSLVADLKIAAGDLVAVIGPSGGGKSTLLNGIAGFLVPRTGQVFWAGQPMPDHPGERPLSILFQDHNLFPHLTVLDNVAIGLRPDMRLSASQKAQAVAALDQVGLGDKAMSYPRDLSGGQQGRAGLARVLLRQRPLLLLDEPFAALGPALKDDMLELTRQIVQQAGITALMVTHDPQDALSFAQYAILVAEGQAQAPVPIGPLFDEPPLALQTYLGRRAP
jgi:thiamine transport system ATP-binding protein